MREIGADEVRFGRKHDKQDKAILDPGSI